FFSSRRRHTRSKRDWSSDVCSSDLKDVPHESFEVPRNSRQVGRPFAHRDADALAVAVAEEFQGNLGVGVDFGDELAQVPAGLLRSEERRVGRAGWARVWAGERRAGG